MTIQRYQVKELIQGYTDLVQSQLDEGRVGYFITFMFRRMRGSDANIQKQMERSVERFYGTVCNRLCKHAGRRSAQAMLPKAIFAFDLPVFKHANRGDLRQTWINGGLHLHGVITVVPRCWKSEHLDQHIHSKGAMYVRGGIERLHVVPLKDGVGSVVDYSMKTIKRMRLSEENIIVLPKSYDELHSASLPMDRKSGEIKAIQSRMNVSEELAEALLRSQFRADQVRPSGGHR